MRRQYEESNKILQQELIKVYKQREAEKEGRLRCEHTLQILTASVKVDKEEIQGLEAICKQVEQECSSQKAELAAAVGKVDNETYQNAKAEIAVQLARGDALLLEKKELQAKFKKCKADLDKVMNETQETVHRHHPRVELRKFATATRAPPSGINWETIRQKVNPPPWMQEGKSARHSREAQRWIAPLGENCWACFLKGDKQILNHNMSPKELWKIVEVIWEAVDADERGKNLVAWHFWNVMKEQFGPAALEMTANVLAACDRLSFNLSVDLLRCIMAGMVNQNTRKEWKAFVERFKNTFVARLEKHAGKHCGDQKALEETLGQSASHLIKTDEQRKVVMKAFEEVIDAGVWNIRDGGWQSAVVRMLDIDTEGGAPQNALCEILYDMFMEDKIHDEDHLEK